MCENRIGDYMNKIFNDKVLLIVTAIAGVIVAGLFILGYSGWQLNESFWNKVTQGEIIAGIVIALPTLVTWNLAINDKRENKKKVVSDNIRETVKYYDQQLYQISKEIAETKELSLQKATKIDYITYTFNNLVSGWSSEVGSSISLDYAQVISVVASIEYPSDIEVPESKEARQWKDNVNKALSPILKELIRQDKTDILRSPELKYFSQITFGESDYKLEKIDFEGKHFVECTFTPEFMMGNAFKNCKFIACSITAPINEDSNLIHNLKRDNNEVLGGLKDSSDEDIWEEELTNKYSTDEQMGEYGRVFDAREGISADSYVEGGKYYQIISDSLSRKDIYNDIIREMREKGIVRDVKSNNVKISISKNYITSANRKDFLPNSQFSGWHSLFSDKIKGTNNFKFYIFCIRDGENYNSIVFTDKKFKEFLQKKLVDKTGKYNFYFNGFDLD